VLKFPEPSFFYEFVEEGTINAENPNDAQLRKNQE
jgi:hypothetical protein